MTRDEAIRFLAEVVYPRGAAHTAQGGAPGEDFLRTLPVEILQQTLEAMQAYWPSNGGEERIKRIEAELARRHAT